MSGSASSGAAAPPPAPPAPAAPVSRARRVADLLAPVVRRVGDVGVDRLFKEARRSNVAVTKTEVKNFLSTKGEQQIFRPLPDSKGKTASETPIMRGQMDLVDLHLDPSRGMKYILVLMTVFNRKLYAHAIASKMPSDVAPGLLIILAGMAQGDRPLVISSDQGNEWTNEVQELLDPANIIHRMKSDKNDVNVIAALDRGIQNLRMRLAKSLAKDPSDWADRLPQVVAEYNNTGSSALHNEPPNEAASGNNKILNFMLEQDNSRKLKHNQNLFEKRKAILEDEGAFRRPLDLKKTFKRGFRASYGPVEQITGFDGSRVQSATGPPIDVKRTLPVNEGSGEVVEGFALGEIRLQRRREKVRPMYQEIIDYLGDDEKSMLALSNHLKREFGQAGYDAYLRSVRAGINLSNVVRLFDDLLLTQGGYFVKVV